MYYQLFLLLISFYTYSADVASVNDEQPVAQVTYQTIESVENITYTRGSTTVTFPAGVLQKSVVLNDIITSCSDAKENRQKAFIEAARWFFGNIPEQDIPLLSKLLQESPESFQEDIPLSDGRSIHYKDAFKSKFRKNSKLPDIDRNIINNERKKYKQGRDFIKKTWQPLFQTISPEQTIRLLTLSDQFDINSIYQPLIKYIANHRELWHHIPDNDISYDIRDKFNPKHLQELQNFLYTRRSYKTNDFPREKSNVENCYVESWYNDLTTTSKQIIKQHLFKNNIIKINPINPDEILVYDYKQYNKKYLVINQATNEYYTLQAPREYSEGKYSGDGKTIKLSARASFNNIYENIYIFDIESKKVLFDGNGKPNDDNTIVYGLKSSDSQYRFHFLDTQKVYTPWPEPRKYISFSPNKKTFATKNDSNTIEFYDMSDLEKEPRNLVPLKVLKSLKDAEISYNADGSEFLIIHNSGNTTLYDGKTLRSIGTLPAIKKGFIHKAGYSEDNKTIIIKNSESISNIAYRRINLRQFSLGFIRTLANAFEMYWKHGQPYTINTEEQLIKFRTMVPDLLIDDKLFTHSKATQEIFKKIVKENLKDTLGPEDAQYFNTADASRETLKLWHKAQQHWQENKKIYQLDSQEIMACLNGNLPIEATLRLFEFNPFNNNCDKQNLKELAITNIQNLKIKLDRSSLNAFLDYYDRHDLSYFILSLKHIQSGNKPYAISDVHADTFLDVKEAAYNLPILNQLFEKHFNYNLINQKTYRLRIYHALYYFELLSAESTSGIYDILNKFYKPTLQFVSKASTLAWKNKNPYPLETQDDLNHCFAFNQELNKEKHAPIAQELRSHKLFALSENVTENIHEKFQGKIYQRLRAKQAMRRNQLHLLKNLSIDQLNMLFNASYQPYNLKKEELDAYSQLPITFRREKLFCQNLLNEIKAVNDREIESTRPSRLAESFANIAYNVKKLMSN